MASTCSMPMRHWHISIYPPVKWAMEGSNVVPFNIAFTTLFEKLQKASTFLIRYSRFLTLLNKIIQPPRAVSCFFLSPIYGFTWMNFSPRVNRGNKKKTRAFWRWRPSSPMTDVFRIWLVSRQNRAPIDRLRSPQIPWFIGFYRERTIVAQAFRIIHRNMICKWCSFPHLCQFTEG